MTDHITIDRKVAKQVLEALGYGYDSARCAAAFDTIHNAETALRAALDAAKKMEPVATVCYSPLHGISIENHAPDILEAGMKLYTAPPPTIPAWQPIETAPNEQGIDVWVKSKLNPDYGVRVVNVHKINHKWFNLGTYSNSPYYISHWMPLPAAPKKEGE